MSILSFKFTLQLSTSSTESCLPYHNHSTHHHASLLSPLHSPPLTTIHHYKTPLSSEHPHSTAYPSTTTTSYSTVTHPTISTIINQLSPLLPLLSSSSSSRLATPLLMITRHPPSPPHLSPLFTRAASVIRIRVRVKGGGQG